MLQVPLPDECPKCGEKFADCICPIATLGHRIRDGSPVPAAASTNVLSRKTVTASKTLTVTERDVGPIGDNSIIEPRVGIPGMPHGHVHTSYEDWDEIEDPEQYTLPPVDRNLYDVQNHRMSTDKIVEPSQTTLKQPSVNRRKSRITMLKEVVVSDTKSEIPFEQLDTLDEDLYRRRGCWCKDCPWLIAYLISALLWILLAALIWQKSKFMGSPFPIQDTECVLRCSQLHPPTVALDSPKPSITTFHCAPTQQWEKDVFHPYLSEINPYGNPNCVQDCKTFPTWQAFKTACVQSDGTPEGPQDTQFYTGNPIVYMDSVRGHWYWIVHVILITNAISLFILLIPLFFCVPMVAFFAIAAIASALALAIRLWLDFFHAYGNFNEISSLLLRMIFTIALTSFSLYVIINAIVIFTRFRTTCGIAAMASRAVNAVAMILLEAIFTMLLLFVWIVIVILVTLVIEGSTEIHLKGNQFYYYSPPYTWFVRLYTLFFAYWTAQLFINCQTIITHGAMARYYFEKNMKNKVVKSHKRLIKYHICTACFAALLFNWLYWLRRCRRRTRIRSRSLFGTGAYGLCFCPASRVVKKRVFEDPVVMKKIDKANPYFFVIHMTVVMLIALVCRLVFTGPYSDALWPDFLMIVYSYFVSLSAINIYRVTKDAMFLCYAEDKVLTIEKPMRNMKMPEPVSNFFGYETRVSPR